LHTTGEEKEFFDAGYAVVAHKIASFSLSPSLPLCEGDRVYAASSSLVVATNARLL